MQKKLPVDDFPLIPKPVDVSPLTKAIVQDIVERVVGSEEREETDEENELMGALLLTFLELTAQLEWRSAMIRWMSELDDWLSDSPNIIRKGEFSG